MAFLIVTVILYFTGETIFNIDKKLMGIAFVRIIGSAMGFILTIFSLEFIPVSKTVVIVYNPFLASLVSYIMIGERMTYHDFICFALCTLGVVMLTDPFGQKIQDVREWFGIMLAFASSTSYNISYVALRKLREHPINSWILVFFIMLVNLMTMPAIFLSYDVYRNNFTHYSDKVWVLIFCTGILTLNTLYFTNLTFYYEKAGRGASYHNFELIFTYVFDVFYMKNNFKIVEILGASLIISANFFLYILKSTGIIN